MSSPEEIYEKERHLLDIVYDLIESDDLSGLFGTLKELEDLSHDQFICLTYSAFQRLIWNQSIEEALHMLDIFPILCYYDTYTEPLLIEYLFDIIKSGEADQVRLIIDSFGININVSNTSKYNLFEQAAFSCQYETMKMLYEEYGLTSNLGYLLENAARMDRPDILEYLWREVGIVPNRHDILIKSAVKAGSLESLKFIRFVIGISDFKEVSIFEIALSLSVTQGNLEIPEFLITYFRILFDPKKILPLGETEPPPKFSLCFTMFHAAQSESYNFIRFCFYVLKLDFATDDITSEWANYLELLKIAVKRGDLVALKLLIEELGINVRLLPEFREDSLVLTILKRPGDNKIRKNLLSYILDFESKENLKSIKYVLTPDQLVMLKKVKLMKCNGYNYKKIKLGL